MRLLKYLFYHTDEPNIDEDGEGCTTTANIATYPERLPFNVRRRRKRITKIEKGNDVVPEIAPRRR